MPDQTTQTPSFGGYTYDQIHSLTPQQRQVVFRILGDQVRSQYESYDQSLQHPAAAVHEEVFEDREEPTLESRDTPNQADRSEPNLQASPNPQEPRKPQEPQKGPSVDSTDIPAADAGENPEPEARDTPTVEPAKDPEKPESRTFTGYTASPEDTPEETHQWSAVDFEDPFSPEQQETELTKKEQEELPDSEEHLLTLDEERALAEQQTIHTLEELGWQSTKKLNWKTLTPEQQKNLQHEFSDIVDLDAGMGITMLTHIDEEGDRLGLLLNDDNQLIGMKFLQFQAAANGKNNLSIEAVQSVAQGFTQDPAFTGKSATEIFQEMGYTPIQEPVYAKDDPKHNNQPIGMRDGFLYGDPEDPNGDLTIKVMMPLDPSSNNPEDRNISVSAINNRSLGTSAAYEGRLKRDKEKRQLIGDQDYKETDILPFDYKVGNTYIPFDPTKGLTEPLMQFKKELLNSHPDLQKSPKLMLQFMKDGPSKIDTKAASMKVYMQEITGDINNYATKATATRDNVEGFNQLRNTILKYHPLPDDFKPPEALARPADSRLAFGAPTSRVTLFQQLKQGYTAKQETKVPLIDKNGKEQDCYWIPAEDSQGLWTPAQEDALKEKYKNDPNLKTYLAIRDAINFPEDKMLGLDPDTPHNQREFQQFQKQDLGEPHTSRFSYRERRNENGEKVEDLIGEWKHSNMGQYMSLKEFEAAHHILQAARPENRVHKQVSGMTPHSAYSIESQDYAMSKLRQQALISAINPDRRIANQIMIDQGIVNKKTHMFQPDALAFIHGKTDEFPKSIRDHADPEYLAGAEIGLAYAKYDFQVEELQQKIQKTQKLSQEINSDLNAKTNQLLRVLVNKGYLPDTERPQYQIEQSRDTALQKMEQTKLVLGDSYDFQLTHEKHSLESPKKACEMTGAFGRADEIQPKYILIDKSEPLYYENGQETGRYRPVSTKELQAICKSREIRPSSVTASVTFPSDKQWQQIDPYITTKKIFKEAERTDNSLQQKGQEIETFEISKKAYELEGLNYDQWQDRHTMKQFDLRANEDISTNRSGYDYEDAEESMTRSGFNETPTREFTDVIVDSGESYLSTIPDAQNLVHAMNTWINEKTDQQARQKVQTAIKTNTIPKEQAEQAFKEARGELKDQQKDRQTQWSQRGQL